MNLTNNSPEMKTVVETFVIEETAALIYDNEQLDAWNAHVAELGLAGQTALLEKEKSPVPFLYMNQRLKKIAETLCPRKVEIEQYNASPIPVEILGLVALSKREGYFDKVQVWYDEQTPGPFCVGLRYAKESDRASGYSWNMNHYLIGKWADVKRSFDELYQMAVQRFAKEKTAEAKGKILTAQRAIEDLKANPEGVFSQPSFMF